MVEEFDVVVIGAGQAGLAAGYFLKERGVAFAVLDGHQRIGDSWRERYDSLVLFSSRAYSALPGIPLSGDPAGYPGKDEIADYLEQYAHLMRLPVRMNDGVASLERHASGFLARTESGKEFKAASVIVATGPFQKPIVPKFADKLASEVAQFTGATYHRPGQLPRGRVLVVGDGATGRQLAAELVPTHDVWLSAGRLRLIVPQRFLGRDIIAWFEATGALRDDKESLHGRFVQLFDPIPGWKLRRSVLRRAGVKIVQRAVDASDMTILFHNGKLQTFDAVIWAIGYHDDSSWLHIPEAVGRHGNYLENRGVSPVPGLFHTGRNWQNNRASALLAGAGNDAAGIVARAVEFVQSGKMRGASQPNELPPDQFP
ncbi:MAG: NAD(P)/FAD-dependent oxidoreductase [Verrucomicrobiota bacterium]|nr:NAD(P)/FAD-dependent oxidoreductase [Verrucomicrobiota bacterium]